MAPICAAVRRSSPALTGTFGDDRQMFARRVGLFQHAQVQMSASMVKLLKSPLIASGHFAVVGSWTAAAGRDHVALVAFQNRDGALTEIFLGGARDLGRELWRQAFVIARANELRGQGVVGGLASAPVRSASRKGRCRWRIVRRRDTRPAGPSPPAEGRNNTDKNIGDDQPVAQPPHHACGAPSGSPSHNRHARNTKDRNAAQPAEHGAGSRAGRQHLQQISATPASTPNQSVVFPSLDCGRTKGRKRL